MQAFLIYIDDWISSKNIEMMDAPEERGYLRLLMRAAKEEDCGLPDDDAQLAVMSLLGIQWWRPTAEKLRRVTGKTSGHKLRDCFYLKDGRLFNARLLKEFNNWKRVSEARSLAGSLGGRPKAIEKQLVSNSLAIVKQTGKQTESKAEANGKQNESIARRGIVLSTSSKELKPSGNIELFSAEEFDSAWERHLKHIRDETKNIVLQSVISMDSFDLVKFRDRHPRYCASWASSGWQYCPLSFLGWVEAGMPLPPPPPDPKPGDKPVWSERTVREVPRVVRPTKEEMEA